jgi:hypothetical protein
MKSIKCLAIYFDHELEVRSLRTMRFSGQEKIPFLQRVSVCWRQIDLVSYELSIEHGIRPFSLRNVPRTSFDHFIISQQLKAAPANPARIPSVTLFSTFSHQIIGFPLTFEGLTIILFT